MDPGTLLFLLLCCLLALLATHSLRDLGAVLARMLRPRTLSAAQRERSLEAVRTVLRASAAACSLCVLVEAVNLLRGMSLSGAGGIGLRAGAALLSVFYALALYLLLLPVQASLRRAGGRAEARTAPVRRRG